MRKLSKKEKKLAIARGVITFVVVIIMILATMYFLPVISKLSNENYRIQFKEKIDSMGIKGVIFVLILQVLQIIVAVVPGQPMEIVSGMLYGTWGGMLLCLVGIFIGTALVFYIVRKVGTSFIQLFFSPEKIDELRKSKVFRNPAKFELLLFIVFVIPVIPKDIFIYLGGISPVRPKRFLAIATIARIPGLFITVFAGNKLSEGSFITVVVMIAALLIIASICYFISSRAQDKIEKEVKKI